MYTALALALFLFAPGQSRPSFDCARASTEAERAICADPTLARLDREIGEHYAVVRRALSGSARNALVEDQRWFLGARDEYFDRRAQLEWAPTLSDRLNGRIAFLTALDTEPRAGLVGTWVNEASTIEVRDLGGGRLHVSAGGADPISARWTCSIDAVGRMRGDVAIATVADDPEWRMRLMRDGAVLKVEEVGLDGEPQGSQYCGFGGMVAGTYLPARGS